MTDNVTVAIVSSSGAVIVAIAALIVNVVWMGRTFDQMALRIEALDKRIDKIEATLLLIQADLKEFYKELTRIKAKIGLE